MKSDPQYFSAPALVEAPEFNSDSPSQQDSTSARSVAPMNSIYRGIELDLTSLLQPSFAPMPTQDDELFDRVVARLLFRLGCKVRNFELTTGPRGLVLRGQVSTYYGKQLAQEVAMEVSGLSILANDIEVRARFPQRH